MSKHDENQHFKGKSVAMNTPASGVKLVGPAHVKRCIQFRYVTVTLSGLCIAT